MDPGDEARHEAEDGHGLEAGEAEDPGRLGHLVGQEARHADDANEGASGERQLDDAERLSASHVLVGFTGSEAVLQVPRTREDALERAQEVRQRALAGESFDDLAYEFTDDAGSKQRGGFLGSVTAGGWVVPFEQAVRGLAGKRSAVVLANHGPVVAGKDLWAASHSIEELEETAKLALMTRGMGAVGLSDAQVAAVVRTFDIDW